MSGRWLALLLALWLLAPLPALGALVTFEVCVTHETDFEDADMGDKLTADENPALGVIVRFIDNTNASTDATMDWTGVDKGCNDNIQLETNNGPYTVKVLRKATVNGNTVEVRNQPNGGIYATTLTTSFSPSQSGSYGFGAGPSDSINILMAASFAVASSNGGLTGEIYTFYDQGCPSNTSGNCATTSGIYIADDNADEKRVITHELGHAVSYAANGGAPPGKDYDTDVDLCTIAYSNDGHKMNSKEYASSAYAEGIAHFYSAIAFNDFGPDEDCVLRKTNVDWDRDGTSGNPDLDDPDYFSCSEGFVAGGETIPEYDYLGEFCIGTGEYVNRATEYDVLRAFWDLVTLYDVPPETLFDIWAGASPDDWTVDGDVQGLDCPYPRMLGSAAAIDYDLGLDFIDASFDNGTAR